MQKTAKTSDLILADEERLLVVGAWYNQGLREHASIASFGVMELNCYQLVLHIC